MRQISVLVKMELCNLYGWNVFRHTKDRGERKKSIALGVIMVILVVMLMCYMGGLSYGYVTLGVPDIVPMYLTVIASAITMVMGVFKAGGVIFKRNGYDILSALPVSNWAVVISRFARLYVESLAFTLAVMVPGLSVYVVLAKPGAWSLLVGLLSAFLVPLLPVALASGIGALVTGISSRMRHKALAETAFMVIFVLAVVFGAPRVSVSMEEMSPAMIKELLGQASDMLGKIYPPARLLGNAVVKGDAMSFLWFVLLSVVAFVLVVTLVAVNFHSICRSLYGTTATHDYKMETLQSSSIMQALVKREAKRYFASSVYVTNTIIGPIMGTAFCAALFFVDLETALVGLPVKMNLDAAIPFIMAGIFSLMNPVCVSISMEGKEWWIAKSLPLSAKQILDSKLAFGLCLVAPFWFVSEIIVMLALRPSITEMLWLVVVPAITMVFSCVFGITVNLKLPKLTWETEVSVVKQSAASAVGGLGCVLVAIAGALPVLLLPGEYTDIVCLAFCIILVVLTMGLYYKNSHVDLKTFLYKWIK